MQIGCSAAPMAQNENGGLADLRSAYFGAEAKPLVYPQGNGAESNQADKKGSWDIGEVYFKAILPEQLYPVEKSGAGYRLFGDTQVLTPIRRSGGL